MFNWTLTEFIPETNLPKNFIFHEEDRFFQISAHDPTIRGILPTDFWQPVFAHQAKNLRVNIIGDHLVYLVGMGPDSDANGRMLMIRVAFDRAALRMGDPATIEHVRKSSMVIVGFLEPHGFHENCCLHAATASN